MVVKYGKGEIHRGDMNMFKVSFDLSALAMRIWKHKGTHIIYTHTHLLIYLYDFWISTFFISY